MRENHSQTDKSPSILCKVGEWFIGVYTSMQSKQNEFYLLVQFNHTDVEADR